MRHELSTAEVVKLKKLRLKKSEWIKNAEVREQETKDHREKLTRFESELSSTRSRLENSVKEEEHLIFKINELRGKLKQLEDNLEEVNIQIEEQVHEHSLDENPDDDDSPSQADSHGAMGSKEQDGFLLRLYTPNSFPDDEDDAKLFSVYSSVPDINFKCSEDYQAVREVYPYACCHRKATCFFHVELDGEYIFSLTTSANARLLVDGTAIIETVRDGETEVEETEHDTERGFFCEFFYIGYEIEQPVDKYIIAAESNHEAIIRDVNLSSYADFLQVDPHCPLEYMIVRCSGFLQIKRSGTYMFSLESEDGSHLLIDDDVVVDNGGTHGYCSARNSKFMRRGRRKMEIQCFINEGSPGLVATMNGPDTGGQEKLLEGYCNQPARPRERSSTRARQQHKETNPEGGDWEKRREIEAESKQYEHVVLAASSSSYKSLGLMCLRKGEHTVELTWEEEEPICLRYKGPDTLQEEKMLLARHHEFFPTDVFSICTTPTKDPDRSEMWGWAARPKSV
eukprot:753049-Hanusia_phi.AAC.3